MQINKTLLNNSYFFNRKLRFASQKFLFCSFSFNYFYDPLINCFAWSLHKTGCRKRYIYFNIFSSTLRFLDFPVADKFGAAGSRLPLD